MSPLLGQALSGPLDQAMAAAGFEMVRYADDFVVLGRTAAEAARALNLVTVLDGKRGLQLHPDEDPSGGCDTTGRL